MRLDSDHDRIISLTRGDIEAFGKIFMPNAVGAATPPFHRNIYRDLEDRSIERLGIIAPRGHSKSTCTSVLFPMHETVYKPEGQDLFIIEISESQAQAMNFLGIIQHNLTENQAILDVFGSLEGPKWTSDEIVTSNGVRIVAKGTGQRIRGMLSGRDSITRPNIIILDDFESESNSGTPEAIDKNISWITKAVEPSLSDHGRLIAIGTIISQRAYLSQIRKDPTWKTHFYQAIMGGRSLWPERFSMERLMRIKQSYSARGQLAAFYQEYMNLPIDVENQAFKPQYIKKWSGELVIVDGIQPCLRLDRHPGDPTWWEPGVLVPVNVSVGIDLAISESHRADFTTIMPLAMDQDGYVFQLPYRRFKTGDIDKIVATVLEVATSVAAKDVVFETVQFQQAVANDFRKSMLAAGKYFGVHEKNPRTSKDSRIMSLQPLYARGKVFHHPAAEELEAEMLAWPGAAHDDLLDAFWSAHEALTPPTLKPFKGDRRPEPRYKEEIAWTVL